MENPARIAGDAIAGGIAIGTLAKLLPPAAALVTILWCCMQMWDHRLGRLWRAKIKALIRRKA